MFNGFKFWEQWATNYTDTMSEAMEQMLKPWQPVEETSSPPSPDKSPEDNLPNPPSDQKNGKLPPLDSNSEPVWTFRGYQLRSGDFTAAMVHFFRAAINRADFWRGRLDSTTNWAVITTAAALSLSWDPQIIIVNTMLVTLFLHIEARRYRYYELYSYRARLLETEFFAAMLVPPFRPTPGWAESLADSLLNPQFPVSMWEAFGRRFRRNYIWIYFILWVAWFSHIWLQPTPANSLPEFINRAAIGQMSGWFVIASGILFNGFLIGVGLLTISLNHVSGDMMPGDGIFYTRLLPNPNRPLTRLLTRPLTTLGFIISPAANNM